MIICFMIIALHRSKPSSSSASHDVLIAFESSMAGGPMPFMAMTKNQNSRSERSFTFVRHKLHAINSISSFSLPLPLPLQRQFRPFEWCVVCACNFYVSLILHRIHTLTYSQTNITIAP